MQRMKQKKAANKETLCKAAHQKTSNRASGLAYEKRAAQYLEASGYRILSYNYRCHLGEIDLIARDGRYLVFVEVKYRADARKGYGAEAVDLRKQRRIINSARWYLMEHGCPEDEPCRFDVVAFLGGEAVLIRDAFSC